MATDPFEQYKKLAEDARKASRLGSQVPSTALQRKIEEVVAPLRRPASQMAIAATQWSERAADIAQRARDAYEASPFAQSVGRWIENGGLERLRDQLQDFQANFRRSLPPNLQELDLMEAWEAAIVMRDTGLTLSWTPPAETVRAIVAADTNQEREEILMAAEAAVVAELTRLLDEPTEHMEHERVYAQRALNTYRDGHHFPAQTAAACILTSIIHERFGKTLGEARREFSEYELEHVGIYRLGLETILVGISQILNQFDPLKDGIPATINRHASVHRLSDDQFRPVNALSMVMLVVAVIKELETLYRLHDDQEAGGATDPASGA